MAEAQPYFISPAFAFVAYPNRNSVPFQEFYRIPEAETVVRGTLRYQGFPQFIKALVDVGYLDGEKKEWLNDKLSWREVTARVIGVTDNSEKYTFQILAFLEGLIRNAQ
jgi:spermidine synthase / saccharopine dehydrogenase (NADP+, L-glutamate-forming)